MKLCPMLFAALAAAPLAAQSPPAARADCRTQGYAPAPAYRSVEPLPDGRVTFRLCAPQARAVTVASNDMPGVIPPGASPGGGLPMTRDARGLWTATTPLPVPPDLYRYGFTVDGLRVPDPLATSFSAEREGTISILEIAGPANDFQAFHADVPHGQVAVLDYWSSALGIQRRAHVYTPPGYMRDGRRYPVLYLVQGSGDSDATWTAFGHAQFILDNLIAAGKARPMIVVMPSGHTPPRADLDPLANTDFDADLTRDLIPFVDAQYRTLAAPGLRAMAGLSMGGMHTLRFGLPRPDLFRWIGLFSIGLGLRGPAELPAYEAANAGGLDQAAKQTKLVYYAVGRDDVLYPTIAPTRALLDRHGIRTVYQESGGGHEWKNWRHYLADFVPRLFR